MGQSPPFQNTANENKFRLKQKVIDAINALGVESALKGYCAASWILT
jgi:hypothetical protein